MAMPGVTSVNKKALLQGLGILSRPHAFIVNEKLCADRSTMVDPVYDVLQRASGVDPSRLGGIEGAVFSEMIKHGWVSMRAEKWRITRAGRYHLKRYHFKRQQCGEDRFRGQHQERAVETLRIDQRVERVVTNHAESPLAWLKKRRGKNGQALVSDAQFEAGERLRADFYFAQMSPRITANWGDRINTGTGRRQGGGGSDIADHVIAAKTRVDAAVKGVGPELAGVLIDVCCYMKGLEATEKSRDWPQRSGKIVLALALNALARHYGLLGDDKPSARKARTEHWGAADYRPGLDAWQ